MGSAPKLLPIRLALLLASLLALGPPSPAATLNNVLSIPGEATDLMPGESGLQQNRLGGFGSDVYYDRASDLYYGLVDAGPARGLQSRATRVQQFTLDVDPATGQIGPWRLRNTIPLKTADGRDSFDALNPRLLNGDASTLGRSLDPEGMVVAPNGHFYISDEYGPSLYEFAPVPTRDGLEARWIRSLTIPDNLKPIDSSGAINYVAERKTAPPLVRGRQDSRGFEGLALSPRGDVLTAVLQDPLADEGERSQGRRGRNVRMVMFDTASGVSTAQYVYQLEDVASINDRVTHDYEDRRQGRSIGVSAVRALDDHRFLVIERDNRGVGPENPVNGDPVASDVGVKRIYEVDVTGATDVSSISLAGMTGLPPGVVPVTKSLRLDVDRTLQQAGLATPEKLEGLTIGPKLDDGQYVLLISTDNDSSALLTDDGQLYDVYTDGSRGPVDGDTDGRRRLPSYLLSFAADLPGYVPPPEPPRLLPGDADQDFDFDQRDLVKILQAGRYLTGQPATWGQGDWNGAPGGSPGQPPQGDGLFDQRDIVAALTAGIYLTGPYHARADMRASGRATSVPEPATFWPLAWGLIGMLLALRFRGRVYDFQFSMVITAKHYKGAQKQKIVDPTPSALPRRNAC